MPVRDEFLTARGQVSKDQIREWYAERVPTNMKYAHPKGSSDTRAGLIERSTESTYKRAVEEQRKNAGRITREDVQSEESGPESSDDATTDLADRIKAKMNEGKA